MYTPADPFVYAADGVNVLDAPVTGVSDVTLAPAQIELQRRVSVPRQSNTAAQDAIFDPVVGVQVRDPRFSTTFTVRPNEGMEDVNSGMHGVIDRDVATQEGDQSPQAIYADVMVRRNAPGSWSDPLFADVPVPMAAELR